MALNIRPIKDPTLISNIINKIIKSKRFIFVIVGRDNNNFWKYYKKKHKNNIFWFKSLKQEKMKNFYKTIDILLITSKSEGSPNIVPEAFSNNVPVVSVPIVAMKGLVKHNYNGLISKNRSADEVVKCIFQARKDLKRLSINSKIFFKKKFILKKTIRKISSYF